ncbi:MAG: hypothetical protein JO129_01215 [Candidatus Dependentiae bacterium]|nr:hypothetical protein [Candidatus Dependentiae bacterium]
MKKLLLYHIAIAIITPNLIIASYLGQTTASENRRKESLEMIAQRAAKNNENKNQNTSIKCNSQSQNTPKTTFQILESNSFELDLTQSNCDAISRWVENCNITESTDLKPKQSNFEPQRSPAYKRKFKRLADLNLACLTSRKPKPSKSEPQLSPSYKNKLEQLGFNKTN